jgi:hypothetical protein
MPGLFCLDQDAGADRGHNVTYVSLRSCMTLRREADQARHPPSPVRRKDGEELALKFALTAGREIRARGVRGHEPTRRPDWTRPRSLPLGTKRLNLATGCGDGANRSKRGLGAKPGSLQLAAPKGGCATEHGLRQLMCSFISLPRCR